MAFWKVLKSILYAATVVGPWLRYKQRKRAKAAVIKSWMEASQKDPLLFPPEKSGGK